MNKREALLYVAAALGVADADDPADAYYNLMGARIDIEEGRGDEVCNRTLRRVEQQVGEARARLRELLESA